MSRSTFTLVKLLMLSIALRETKALFSDNASNDDFSCPAFTTCPLACARAVEDCPTDIKCPEGATLCIDGSCASITEGGCDPDLVNPCIYSCAPVACTKSDNFFDTCTEIYGARYDYASWCMQFTWNNLQQEDQTSASFMFFYIWISVVTFLVYTWSVFNQRLRPIPESTQYLQEAVSADKNIQNSEWTVTSYRSSFIGNIIYGLTMITLVSFHVILGVCTVFYYWTEEGILREHDPVFADERQVLFIFEVVWMIGFFWSLAFKWNQSVGSIFLRRCAASEATQVAVFAAYKDPASELVEKEEHLSIISKIHRATKKVFATIGIFIFSDVNRKEDLGSYTFCQVCSDQYGNKWFSFRLRRYIYDNVTNKFVPGHISVDDILKETQNFETGLTTEESVLRRQAVGMNTMDMQKPNFFRILIREFSKPFYHYQMYMIWTWFPLWYFYMAAVNTIVVSLSGFSVSYFLYKNEQSLYRLAQVRGTVEVLKNGSFETIDHADLVPGDIVQITPGVAYSDMIVIKGDHIVIDESALTGETSPISKTKFDVNKNDRTYDSVANKRNTIFAGTTIVEAESTSLALITKTGSFTSKGELVRDILSYRRHVFKFDVEVQLVIVILFLWAVICFSIVLWILEDEPVYGWFYGMFVISTCIPMLLPTVFVVSVGVSESRLSTKDVACSNPDDILVAGKVKVAFFDKTGTLTQKGLSFHSVRSSDKWDAKNKKAPKTWLKTAMSVCHGLTISNDGKLIGNSVDKVMFKASKATLKRINSKRTIELADGNHYVIAKQNEFDHQNMIQSVIVKNDNGDMYLFAKGSAESIKALCEPGTLPPDFDEAAKESASEGLYQISIAMKTLTEDEARKYEQNEHMNRLDVEKDLQFLGFLNFKNKLKAESEEVLKKLKEGGIKNIMLTGDNIFTGIKIARECGMVEGDKVIVLGEKILPNGDIDWVDLSLNKPPLNPITALELAMSDIVLAVTGKVWRHLLENNQDYALEICEYIVVYARCTPYDKVSVVSCFIHKGNITLMCGDGGNDCGALKTAHVGIALSNAEASIVSPFTSLNKSITSVIDVLKEGRCALASAFSSYKYMLMYGQIATINQIITAYFYTSFSEWSWVFLDGIWLVTMAFTLPLAKPAAKLAPKRPTSSLFGWHTLTSYLGVLIINFFFVVIALTILFEQDWFICRQWGSTEIIELLPDNYETGVIFIMSGFQYIISAIVYNFGYAHRAWWIKNYMFVCFALVFFVLHIYITLSPGYVSCFFRVNCDNEHIVREITSLKPLPISNAFHTTVMPVAFRIILLVLMLANFFAIVVWEYFIVNGLLPHVIHRCKSKSNIIISTDSKNIEKAESTIVV